MRAENGNRKWIDLAGRSQKLLEDTIAGNLDEVVKAIEAVHATQYAPTFYNNEQALRYVIKFVYIAVAEHYLKIEEPPTRHGIADVVFIPKQRSRYPAMVVELKWNRSAKGAIGQSKEKNYPVVIKDYGGEIVLVGINYDKKTKGHSCLIEKM